MIPVLEQKNAIYYVSEHEIINFISDNMPMDHNKCCDFVRKHINSSAESSFWEKEDMINPKKSKYYDQEAVKWIKAFFETHPWIERMMIVFDD